MLQWLDPTSCTQYYNPRLTWVWLYRAGLRGLERTPAQLGLCPLVPPPPLTRSEWLNTVIYPSLRLIKKEIYSFLTQYILLCSHWWWEKSHRCATSLTRTKKMTSRWQNKTHRKLLYLYLLGPQKVPSRRVYI